MHNENPLRNDLPQFTPDTAVSEAIGLVEKKTSHIPFFAEGQLLGMLPYELVLEADSDAKLGSLMYESEIFSVRTDTHWQEVLEVFGKYDTDRIPVLDKSGECVGYYLLNDFIHRFSETPFLKETGSFIVVEKAGDYSFAEVSQIVESNRSQLLGIFVSDLSVSHTQLTIKVMTDTVSDILDDFRRYGYVIVLEKEDDLYLRELKDKSDYFDKYLMM
ncbi:MAG: CBS domain-containing protein [Capnocytophaga sp.]|nr:CBS domain-containing protein [Capnocytophaga sp.]